MAQTPRPWTLEDLIDFESEIAAATGTPPEVRAAVQAASHPLTGAAARRVGLRVWLEGVRSSSAGKKFTSALALVGAALVLGMFVAGIAAVLGLLDRTRTGVPVTLFVAILLGGQWLVLLLAAVAWLLRHRAAGGFSAAQELLGKLARRLAGARDAPWWSRLMACGGCARAAALWRLGRLAQAAGVGFNAGILCGLAGLVLLRHVGFFWETSTEGAMRSLLERLTRLLAVPWASWWPGAVPDATVIAATRWLPERELPPGPAAWWQFLLMATLVWGLLPRLLLWAVAWQAGRRALAQLDFQAREHRVLWRDLTGVSRLDTDGPALDGVLVLDVGGAGLTAEGLRPFLLRRLRVHPAVWHAVAVLDPGVEAEAARALAKAPAGVVVLAEGWALSPARMNALLAKIRSHAGSQAPVKFLIANVGPGHTPVAPTTDERQQWERFVDSLRDPAAEVFFFEPSQPGL